MKAIQIAGEALVWADFDRPQCGPGELRIQVAASAINRAGTPASISKLNTFPVASARF